jgi:hypothetical protein
MAPAALWYRHWLEIRVGLLVAFIGVALLSAAYPFFAVGNDGMVPHVWLSSSASWVLGVFVWGTGVRTNALQPDHPSYQFTLGLPVSRVRLILTRLAAACAALVALFGVMLVSNSLVLLLIGRAPALGAMAASSALAALLVVAIMTSMSVIGLANENHFGWVYPVAFIAALYWGWPATTAFVGSPEVPWTSLATLALVIAAALSASVAIAYKKDF